MASMLCQREEVCTLEGLCLWVVHDETLVALCCSDNNEMNKLRDTLEKLQPLLGEK